MVDREVAKLKKVKDLFKGEYKESSGIDNPHKVEAKNGSYSRINTVATVEDTYINSDETYGSLQITDSTANIRVKAFDDKIDYLEGIDKGDIVKVIGKIREDDDGRFILGEIIKKIEDPEYVKMKELEIGKSENEKSKKEEAEEINKEAEDLVIEEDTIE